MDYIENYPISTLHIDWSQCFVDAPSTSADNHSGIAGIILDDKGSWILGFHRKIVTTNILLAELMGIYEALQVAQQAHITKIVIYSDCLMALQMLNERELIPSIYVNLLYACSELNHEFAETKFMFVRRQINEDANILAKYCRNSDKPCHITRSYSRPLDFRNSIILSICSNLSDATYDCIKHLLLMVI